jgi:hypothetical protein
VKEAQMKTLSDVLTTGFCNLLLGGTPAPGINPNLAAIADILKKQNVDSGFSADISNISDDFYCAQKAVMGERKNS